MGKGSQARGQWQEALGPLARPGPLARGSPAEQARPSPHSTARPSPTPTPGGGGRPGVASPARGGPGPGARRVSPSLDPGLREGRAAESGPGPGPTATLARGGAGGACRRWATGRGGWARRRVSRPGKRGPRPGRTRTGPGPAPSRAGGYTGGPSPDHHPLLARPRPAKPRRAGARHERGHGGVCGGNPQVPTLRPSHPSRCSDPADTSRDTKVQDDTAPRSLQGVASPGPRGSRRPSFLARCARSARCASETPSQLPIPGRRLGTRWEAAPLATVTGTAAGPSSLQAPQL